MGTPAVTTRGMKNPRWKKSRDGSPKCSNIWATPRPQRVRGEVAAFAADFPLYARRLEAAEAALAGARSAR